MSETNETTRVEWLIALEMAVKHDLVPRPGDPPKEWEALARAVIARLTASGFKILPREPTEAMHEGIKCGDCIGPDGYAGYLAAWDAAD